MLTALTGGLLIGLAALLYYALLGRIAGISGQLYSALLAQSGRRLPLAFLAGLVVGGWVAAAWFPLPAAPLLSPWLVIGAGLLVGYGTRISNGCTSGHGVCGLARRSPRSLAAVAVFMSAGALTATFLRPLLA